MPKSAKPIGSKGSRKGRVPKAINSSATSSAKIETAKGKGKPPHKVKSAGKGSHDKALGKRGIPVPAAGYAPLPLPLQP